MLILTSFITRHELKPLLRFLTLDDIRDGARKVVKGLATELKTVRRGTDFQFFKVRIGPRNAARMVVFVVTGNNSVVPLLIRMKKDKVFGMNMSPNNPKVLQQIDKNLEHVLDDFISGNYEKFEL